MEPSLEVTVGGYSQAYVLRDAFIAAGVQHGQQGTALADVYVDEEGVVFFCDMGELTDVQLQEGKEANGPIPDDIAIVMEGIYVPEEGDWRIPVTFLVNGTITLRPNGTPVSLDDLDEEEPADELELELA
jgi:hypothetical protein